MPDYINMTIQATLAGVALWYTIETRKLRKHSESQLALSAQQARLAIAPFLVPGLQASGPDAVAKKATETAKLTEEERAEFIKSVREGNLRFVASAYNPSSKVASNVQIFIFDPNTKSFLEGDQGKAWVEEKGHEIFTISAPYFTHDQIKTKMIGHFGDYISHLLAKIDIEEVGYMALVYQDIEQRVYLVKRHFILKGDEVSHKTPKIYF